MKARLPKGGQCFLAFNYSPGEHPAHELLRAPARMESAFPISTSNNKGCFWLDSATGKPTVNRAGHSGWAPCHPLGKSEAAFYSSFHCCHRYKALVWLSETNSTNPTFGPHEITDRSSMTEDFHIPVNYTHYDFSSLFFQDKFLYNKS